MERYTDILSSLFSRIILFIYFLNKRYMYTYTHKNGTNSKVLKKWRVRSSTLVPEPPISLLCRGNNSCIL